MWCFACRSSLVVAVAVVGVVVGAVEYVAVAARVHCCRV